MINNEFTCKYETPYNIPFEIMLFSTNGKVAFKMGKIKLVIIYVVLRPIKLKPDVYYVHLNLPVIYLCIYI